MEIKGVTTPFEQRIADRISSNIIRDLSSPASPIGQISSQLFQLIQQQTATLVNLQSTINKLVDVMGGKFENPEMIAAQKQLVPSAGTAIQLPIVLIPYDKKVVIRALPANTGTIYVGNSKSDAEDTTKSFPLGNDDSVKYKIRELSQLWVNSTVNNEGIIWTVEQ